MFENLQTKLSSVLKTLRGRGLLSEKDIEENVRSIRLALLEADVHYRVVKDFTDSVREKAAGTLTSRHLSPGELVSRIVFEELVRILGGKNEGLKLTGKPPVVMLVGLQGSGKTTTAVKLAHMLTKEGRRPYLISVDVYRPAAMEQLRQLADKNGIGVFDGDVELSPIDLVQDGMKEVREAGFDVTIIDTAGRLHIDDEMMDELVSLKKKLEPSEILLVADGMAGQDAVNMAKSFDERVGISGVVLSKMEGDARGGAALSIYGVTGNPVKFVGTGERVEDLDPFHPERMASRILGMGDVQSLVDRATKLIDQEESTKVAARIKSKGELSLEDFLASLKQIRKLGPLGQIAQMLPGVGGALPKTEVPDDSYLDRMEAILLSMTPRERAIPKIMNGSRRQRVARGSGTTVMEVNRLLKQFKEMEVFMKKMGFAGRGKKHFLKNFPFN